MRKYAMLRNERQDFMRKLEVSREKWLLGYIDDIELRETFQKIDFETVRRLKLVEAFDETSQIVCVAEWIAELSGGIDSDETVRRFAERAWRSKITGNEQAFPINFFSMP